jgi:4-amino-4-deoxy-L-arabinose transferase-like glycosyltransferase
MGELRSSAAPFERTLLFVLALAILPYLLQLDASSIWDANEAYYVETPREMIERGDYINPSFNYEPRFNKPVLSYWVVAGLYNVFGVSVAVERAAIAVAAMMILAATFFIARTASDHPLAPLLATLGLAAGPRFFMFSRRILVDMAIAAMMTLILLFFALAERYPERRRLFLVLMYVSVGLGVLTKGPVAAVVPALVFLVYLAWHRELGRLRTMMIPTGTVIALAIVAPWYLALYAQHGWTYISEFFIAENLGRYTETVGAQARGPLFYLPVVLHDSLPWSLCLPAIVATWWQSRRSSAKPGRSAKPSEGERERIRTLLLLWIGVTVLFFSFSQTKQDLYIFPIVGAVAALGGDWIARVVFTGREVGSRWLTGTLLALSILLAVLGGFVLYLFTSLSVYRIEGALVAGIVLAGGGVALGILTWRRLSKAAVIVTLSVFIAFNWTLAIRVLPSFEAYKPSVPLSEIIQREAAPSDVVAHFDVALPSMVFYLRRHIDIWFDRDAFVNQIRSAQTVYAVLPADRYEQIRKDPGVSTCELARRPTSDVRLRNLLRLEQPPALVLITNRCSRTTRGT